MKKLLLLIAAAAISSASYAQLRVSMAEENPFEFPASESYVGIFLGDETRANFGLTDANYLYIGPDADRGRNLWVWDGSSHFGETPDLNSFGIPGEYMAYIVGSAGWSGIGYNIAKDAPVLDLSFIDSNWSFHLAVKSTSKETFTFTITDGDGTEAQLVLGDGPNGDGVAAVGNFPRDGEWYNIEAPLDWLEDQFEFTFGGDASKCYADKNMLVVLAGGVEGTEIDFDAAFYHGPKVDFTGVRSVSAAAAFGNTIYDITGRQTDASRRGLYIREGKKFVK